VILTSALVIGLFWGTEKAEALLRLPEKVLTPLVLLGTLKDDGLAGGLALALFGKKNFRTGDGLGRFHDRLHHLA